MNTWRWLSWSRLHVLLTLLLTGSLLVLAYLAAVGVIGVKAPTPSPVVPPSASPASWEPAQPWVRHVPNVQFLGLLGQEIRVFEFKGARLSAWIEVEFDGKKTRLGENLGSHLWETQALPGADPMPSGYILWARTKKDAKESWRLAIGIRDKSGNVGWSAVDDFQPPGSGMMGGSEATQGGDEGYPVLDQDQSGTLFTVMNNLDKQDDLRRKAELRCRFHPGK